jgi:hypothetical protein
MSELKLRPAKNRATNGRSFVGQLRTRSPRKALGIKGKTVDVRMRDEILRKIRISMN